VCGRRDDLRLHPGHVRRAAGVQAMPLGGEWAVVGCQLAHLKADFIFINHVRVKSFNCKITNRVFISDTQRSHNKSALKSFVCIEDKLCMY